MIQQKPDWVTAAIGSILIFHILNEFIKGQTKRELNNDIMNLYEKNYKIAYSTSRA